MKTKTNDNDEDEKCSFHICEHIENIKNTHEETFKDYFISNWCISMPNKPKRKKQQSATIFASGKSKIKWNHIFEAFFQMKIVECTWSNLMTLIFESEFGMTLSGQVSFWVQSRVNLERR